MIPSEVTERGIAVSPEELRQIPRVVAVARAGLITGLADRPWPKSP